MPLSINLKPSQSQSPAVIQLMSLLQMNELELQAYVQKAFEENPIFEIGCPQAAGASASAPLELVGAVMEAPDELASLRHDLAMQLSFVRAPEEVRRAAGKLAEWLDKNAFLSPEDFDAFRSGVGPALADAALRLLQGLSPAGIGARSLSECLLLQLRALPGDTSLAEQIAENYLEPMAKGHFQRIAELTGCTVSSVKKACNTIRALEPRPYQHFEPVSPEYLFPDVYLSEDGQLSLNNRGMPTLSLSNDYLRLMKGSPDSEVRSYLREKYEQANLLLQNIESRKRTIIKCAEALVARQSEFFRSRGRSAPLPFTREQLANQLGLSISTVSRALSGKFLQCPFGTYAFDSFFSAQVGSTVGTPERIKHIIADLIAGEDKASPLSDQEITVLLSSRGLVLSRRTVAKYRSELNIPSTFSRREG